MPAYNFQSRFADGVRSGAKRCTIRKKRRRATRVGDRLYLYTRQRSKGCEKLGEGACTGVSAIDLYQGAVVVKGVVVSEAAARVLAVAEGFEGVEEFYTFFQGLYGLPCVGALELIEWRLEEL